LTVCISNIGPILVLDMRSQQVGAGDDAGQTAHGIADDQGR
jgi:hypothetical protein